MAEEVFVHIGLPKTATTYLQTIVWSARDQLRSEGLLLPGDDRRDHLWATRVVREEPVAPGFFHDRTTSSWDRLRAEIEAWPGRALVSHEFFAAATAEQAARMVEQLAPARVHVVVTAREPLGLFAAGWQESLKNRETWRMSEFSTEEAGGPSVVWNWRTLDLRAVLERWGPTVPADHVHVLPLDPGAPRDAIWRRFAGLLGLDADAYDLGSSFPNASMGVVEAETLRRVNEHLVAREDFTSSFDRGVFVRTFLADERLVPRGGERFAPAPDQVEDCRRRGRRARDHVVAQGYDVRGEVDHLLVPTELPERRRADSVTDAEVAATATELVAVLLADVRAQRIELRQARRATEQEQERAEQAEAEVARAHGRVDDLYARRPLWRRAARRLRDGLRPGRE
ncbi:MAG: hypothetical protein JWR20_1485 [Marmoricola sp.]|nr:hypothetical protein [Marmoricola sp.]